MSVPKAPVDKHNCLESRKNNVWPTREASASKPISQAASMQAFSYLQLDFRVRSPDPRHLRGSLLGSQDVSQGQAAFLARFRCASSATMNGFITRATSAMTGTTTEFPNCL